MNPIQITNHLKSHLNTSVWQIVEKKLDCQQSDWSNEGLVEDENLSEVVDEGESSVQLPTSTCSNSCRRSLRNISRETEKNMNKNKMCYPKKQTKVKRFQLSIHKSYIFRSKYSAESKTTDWYRKETASLCNL